MLPRVSSIPPGHRLAGRMLTIACCTPLVACSLLFAPADPAAETDGGRKGDARSPADAGPLCPTDDFRWSHRLPIAFSAVVGLPQQDVPVGIRFTPADFTSLRLPDDPSSLRFVEALGTQMPHEVEAWDPDVGGLVWVLASNYPGMPEVLSFDMFYGDPEAIALNRAEELWLTADYSAVFHFNRESFNDSLSPDVSATISESITGTEINADGAFGHAMRFSGLEDTAVVMAHSSSHQSEARFSMSVEARFQATHASPESRFVVQKPGAYSVRSSTATTDESLATLSVLGTEVTSEGSVLVAQSWTHAAMDVNAVPDLAYFLDGALVGIPVLHGMRDTSVQPLSLGESFEGDMDELRISNQSRAAQWYALQAALFTGELQSFGDVVKCAP